MAYALPPLLLLLIIRYAAAAVTKSLQSCLTLCVPIDSSPPGSPVPGILQARTLEWVAISFSSAWKWKVKVKSLSRVQLLATPWTAAHQAPLPMGNNKVYKLSNLTFFGYSLFIPCDALMHTIWKVNKSVYIFSAVNQPVVSLFHRPRNRTWMGRGKSLLPYSIPCELQFTFPLHLR